MVAEIAPEISKCSNLHNGPSEVQLTKKQKQEDIDGEIYKNEKNIENQDSG